MNIGGQVFKELPATGAVFLAERSRRLALWRIWERAKAPLLFVGLNPSTATEYQDDPTIRRVARFARERGFGGLFVGNLFDQVTPYPEALDKDRGQAANDETLRQMRGLCGAALVGWGHFGAQAGTRPAEVLALVDKPAYCLGKTKDGWPRHPLYVAADKPFEEYERGTK